MQLKVLDECCLTASPSSVALLENVRDGAARHARPLADVADQVGTYRPRRTPPLPSRSGAGSPAPSGFVAARNGPRCLASARPHGPRSQCSTTVASASVARSLRAEASFHDLIDVRGSSPRSPRACARMTSILGGRSSGCQPLHRCSTVETEHRAVELDEQLEARDDASRQHARVTRAQGEARLGHRRQGSKSSSAKFENSTSTSVAAAASGATALAATPSP